MYELKRKFGFRVDIYQNVSSVPDMRTGVKTIVKKRYTVNRAVALPSALMKQFSYDKTYVSAGKDFTYGGLYDLDTRGFLVDSRDLPPDLDIDTDMYFVFEGKRYDSAKVQKLEHNQGYLLKGTWAKGGLPNQIIDGVVSNVFRIQQGVSTNPGVSLGISSHPNMTQQQS